MRQKTAALRDFEPALCQQSNPITGIAGCCARAASGQAAAPPSSVMNSRLHTVPNHCNFKSETTLKS
jgi:hypothetical protein